MQKERVNDVRAAAHTAAISLVMDVFVGHQRSIYIDSDDAGTAECSPDGCS